MTDSTPAKRLLAVLFWLCQGLGWLAGGAAGAEPPAASEYGVKAAFLYNFTKFVEWPEKKLGDDRSPIVIGVLGTDPFEGELRDAVKGRKVKGRDIEVFHFADGEAAKGAHMLFVSADASAKALRGALGAYGVLTVGESAAFTRGGGIITFRMRDDRLAFEINTAAAERAGLKISAQVLKLATVVRREP